MACQLKAKRKIEANPVHADWPLVFHRSLYLDNHLFLGQICIRENLPRLIEQDFLILVRHELRRVMSKQKPANLCLQGYRCRFHRCAMSSLMRLEDIDIAVG